MLQRIKSWLLGPQAKSDPLPGGSGGWNVLGDIFASWQDADGIWKKLKGQDLDTYYRGVVFACVTKLCVSAQSAPLRIGRDTPDGWKDEESHPLWNFMRSPNPDMNYAEFLWHVISHLELSGCSYIWKWRNRGMQLGELWPVPTSWVTPRVDQAGRIVAYEIYQGASRQMLTVAASEIIRINYPDPRSLTASMGPLQAALRDVTMDDERQDYLLEMMVNLRVPGTIFYQPESWSPEQKDEVRAAIGAGLGRGNRGKPLFMEGEGAKIEIPSPMSDLDWPGLTGLNEARICSAFGVPPILIGLRVGLDSATYSNYEMAERSFYTGKMAPLWSKLDAGLTRGLIVAEREDRRLELYHDTEEVPAMQEDRDKAATRAGALFGAGLATRNEAREMAGLEMLPPARGDVFVLPLNLVEVPMSGELPVEPPEPSGQEKFESTEDPDKAAEE
ncbi:MAG: hypothetical protein AMXMBFR7_33080 [Planctomycetota bacterium]